MENFNKRIVDLEEIRATLVNAVHPLESIQMKNIQMCDCIKRLEKHIEYLKELTK